MRTIKTLLAVLLLSLLSTVVRATEARQVVIQTKSGTQVSYLLRQKPMLTFHEQTLVVTTGKLSFEYAIPETAKLIHETVTLPDEEGLEDVQTGDVKYRFDGDALIFPALPADSRISIYALNGNLLFSRENIPAGDYMFSAENLQQGVFLIQVNDITCKISKP